MITRDIHSNKETVEVALYDLKQTILLAKKQREKVVALIVGYGSTGKTHKIQTAVLEALEDYRKTCFIKDYIRGNNLDIFSSIYHSFKFKDLIPEGEKRSGNPGVIYIIV